MWAVLNYMLGVRDEFNICLLPMEAAEIEFDIIMRNILGPYVQVETPLFKQMVHALIDGLQSFLPMIEYESQLFLTRRAVGIPGYQYDVDLERELPHRNIFTDKELKYINVPLFDSPNILIVKAKEMEDIKCNLIDCDNAKRRSAFMLPENVGVQFREVSKNETEFMASLNAKKYNKLGRVSKMYLNMNLSTISGLNNRFTKFLIEQIIGHNLGSMRTQQKTRKSKK